MQPHRKKDNCPGQSAMLSYSPTERFVQSVACVELQPYRKYSFSYHKSASLDTFVNAPDFVQTKVICAKIQFPQPSIFFFFSFLLRIKQENGEQEGEMDEEGLPQYSFFRIFQWRLHCLERKRLDQITNAYATEDRFRKVTTGSFPVSRGWGWFQFLWIVGTCHCKKTTTNKRKI